MRRSDGRTLSRQAGSHEIGVIEGIKRFRSNLETESLFDVDHPGKREVEVFAARFLVMYEGRSQS
jgi:hypothetical protein